MGLRERLRELERLAEREMIAFQLGDVTTARFHEDDVWPECFLHESERGRRHYFGKDPGPAHQFVGALRNAAEGKAERTQGSIILHFLGADTILRGERGRPGPPVRETSPGVYE